jgi:hypothetical protein
MLSFPKSKYLFWVFFIIILGGILFLLFSFKHFLSQRKYQKILSENEAILIIDYGQGKQRWFKGEAIDGMTVFDVLTSASLAGNFNFQANSHLTTLDNLTNNEKSKWTCYLNEKQITQPLNKITIKPKDKIVCRYR